MTTGGWVPGHDDEVELNEDIEDDDNIPRLELGLREIGLASAPANDVDTDGHGQVEHSLRENGQIVDFFPVVSDANSQLGNIATRTYRK